ncbi:hypothetical protein [Pseudomonas sp. PMCC200344]|uniref:hypothetical protein n=1 Tax=Pseudomonas sp. PMCC200344 TaxID=3042028 RepID=UPI0024B376C4|nr:hypothetical protein [Pseudomonas sp. PMCC200344]
MGTQNMLSKCHSNLSPFLHNELTQILPLLEAHRAELLGVVVEETYKWYWLVDGLKAAGSFNGGRPVTIDFKNAPGGV